MTRGILFFNTGDKCCARLLVAVHSLRNVYDGKVCIVSMGAESHKYCSHIAHEYDCQIKKINVNMDMSKHYWYEKARMHKYTPYDTTIFIDSDTIIQKDPSVLFPLIEEHGFVVPQFSNWRTGKRIIQNRLKKWENINKELVDLTIELNGPSVNVGVYGFRKDSILMKHWFDFTIQNTEDVSLPEESTCHLMLNMYGGKIVDSYFNYSCKHDSKDPEDAYIIHYHGRKHCRLDDHGKVLFNGDRWVSQWLEVYVRNVCNVRKWYETLGDGKLTEFMRSHEDKK